MVSAEREEVEGVARPRSNAEAENFLTWESRIEIEGIGVSLSPVSFFSIETSSGAGVLQRNANRNRTNYLAAKNPPPRNDERRSGRSSPRSSRRRSTPATLDHRFGPGDESWGLWLVCRRGRDGGGPLDSRGRKRRENRQHRDRNSPTLSSDGASCCLEKTKMIFSFPPFLVSVQLAPASSFQFLFRFRFFAIK